MRVLAYLTYMRVRTLLMAIVAVAAIALFVWRPWVRSDSPPEEAASAAALEQSPTAPPPAPPSTVMDPGAGAPPQAASPPAAPSEAPVERPVTLARVPDTAVVPVASTADDRARLPGLFKNLMGIAPSVARMRAEYARAGRPLPPEAKKLIDMKRTGASHDAQVEYARTAFADPLDREIAMRFLASDPSAVAAPNTPPAVPPAAIPVPGAQPR